MATIIVSILLVLAVLFIIIKLVKDKKSGKGTCNMGGHCDTCSMAGKCHQKEI